MRGLTTVATMAVTVAVWASLRKSPKARAVSVATQTCDRERVAAMAQHYPKSDICFNVLYTAALYSVLCHKVTLDTMTHNSLRTRVPIAYWMLLRGRKNMMEKALTFFGASTCARELYAAHRRKARMIAAQ
jgi:hypothetical protein